MSTPIDFEMALYIDEPYALWIKQGIQTAYVDVKRIPESEERDLALVGDKAYGRIVLSAPVELRAFDFHERRDAHRIDIAKQTEYARENPNWLNGPFYLYTFKFVPFPEPIPYEIMEDLAKSCSRVRKIKKLVVAKAVCPKCGKDPCVCEEEKPCPKCGKNPCECEDEEPEKTTKTLGGNVVEPEDILLKPKGPWGDGFKECEAYVREHYPKIKDPTRYCAGIYQNQKKTDPTPEFVERPTAYDVILHEVPEGWITNIVKEKDYEMTVMTNVTDELSVVQVHKISFNKSFCPCAIVKVDYKPFSEWMSLRYNFTLPEMPSDIAKKK